MLLVTAMLAQKMKREKFLREKKSHPEWEKEAKTDKGAITVYHRYEVGFRYRKVTVFGLKSYIVASLSACICDFSKIF